MNTFHIFLSHMALEHAELTGTKCEQWRDSVGFYVGLVLIFTAIIREQDLDGHKYILMIKLFLLDPSLNFGHFLLS